MGKNNIILTPVKNLVVAAVEAGESHKTGSAPGWFRDNNVDLLDWPTQSLDLNPIEHLWHELERKLGNRNFRGQPAAMGLLYKKLGQKSRQISLLS